MVKFTLFFLSLSLLIILHEFGHFITARLFKMRVNKFYLFFDFLFPLANVMNFSIFKKKVGETTYGLGWFPFGGYVDIHGMQAEENADPNALPAPDEFRAKKPWQRLIVLAGGISVNYILAIIIYSMLIWAYGEQSLPVENAKYGVYCDSVMIDLGMHNGDRIISVDGKSMGTLRDVTMSILLDNARKITVDRGGKKMDISIPNRFAERVISKDVKLLFIEQIPFVIDSLIPGKNAQKAGLMKGDSLVSVNGDTMTSAQEFVSAINSNKNKMIDLGVARNGELKVIKVGVTNEGTIGIANKSPDKFLDYKTEYYGFFGAWGRGFTKTWEVLVNYVKQMKLLFTKAGASKIGGFATMGSLFPSEWDWDAFWGLTAMISVILAFMNLLPIPALDGGYILFVLWEMITGKKVSDKFMQRALSIGMYIILGLLIYANGNDIIRAFKH